MDLQEQDDVYKFDHFLSEMSKTLGIPTEAYTRITDLHLLKTTFFPFITMASVYIQNKKYIFLPVINDNVYLHIKVLIITKALQLLLLLS